MSSLLQLSNQTLFVYYLVSNLFYLGLLITAFVAAARHRLRLSSLRLQTLDNSPFTPPISILVPAHNEEATIVESVRSLLSLDYPDLQIVIVNDGSTDRTLELLRSEFGLRATSMLYVQQIKAAPVRAFTLAVSSRPWPTGSGSS